MELFNTLQQISPASDAAYQKCIARFDNIAKPIGSLGKLETLLAHICAAQHTDDADISKKCVLVFCADNGVLKQGVAQSTHDVTTAIARSLMKSTTSVSCMAKAAGADVFPVDMGMIDTVENMENYSLSKGTNDISEGPAMSRQQAIDGILTGIKLVGEKKSCGYNLIATGEAGIGNTTTSTAVLAALTGESVETLCGRGSGLTDEGLIRKQNAIKKALKINNPDKTDIIDVISKVGGFDIAAMTGAFIGGALYHIPIIMDGFISGAAAMCAVGLCKNANGYIIPSHITAEPAGQLIMEKFGFSPIIHADMRLGEGTGAVALMPLLDLSVSVYRNAATFAKINVEAYKKWDSI